MSIFDHFKQMAPMPTGKQAHPDKKEGAEESSAAAGEGVVKQSPTLEEIDRLIHLERNAGDERFRVLEREIHELRTSLERTELSSKSRRDTQVQSLKFLQQDAEREIKFLERK